MLLDSIKSKHWRVLDPTNLQSRSPISWPNTCLISAGLCRIKSGANNPPLFPVAPLPGSSASTTATEQPASARCSAVERPAMPAPITATSTLCSPSIELSLGPGGAVASHKDVRAGVPGLKDEFGESMMFTQSVTCTLSAQLSVNHSYEPTHSAGRMDSLQTPLRRIE